ncbi:flagellar hook-basal body complex protein FliE [Marinospirillum celere]|uniref:Flagellar hook-basal body complex protein FliE n=1 Tax=Marinospirillum celere TaxID=1122252 RepID=A0A1I1H6F3_9GAMM|nr:flagellar hook-basal body complex protein FliE [Marinospirillum celere]SFC17638.1 flagellar hook-basal body complex protein FliE [Marinospirillum celere]
MVERADISSVLSQIRASQQGVDSSFASAAFAQRAPLVKGLQEGAGVAGVEKPADIKEVPSFSSLLKQAVDNVNGHQKAANDLRTRYELGDPNVDITNVMIAAQKSSVSFEAMTQVRNRLVGAYQEIMRMPI